MAKIIGQKSEAITATPPSHTFLSFFSACSELGAATLWLTDWLTGLMQKTKANAESEVVSGVGRPPSNLFNRLWCVTDVWNTPTKDKKFKSEDSVRESLGGKSYGEAK